MITRTLERMPDLELADPAADLPRHLGSLTSLPVRFTPTAPVRG